MSQGVSNFGIQLERALVHSFEDAGWQVEHQLALSSGRPDFVAISPDGDAVVGEVKATGTPVHFAAIAQVAAQRQAVEDLPGVRDVATALFALGPVSTSARKAAGELNVVILSAEPALVAPPSESLWPDAEQMARQWVQQFTERGLERSRLESRQPLLRQVLPELHLRHLVARYRLSDVYADPDRRAALFELIRNMQESYAQFVGHAPNPLVLRTLIASVLVDDEVFFAGVSARAGASELQSPEQFERIALAGAGAVLVDYLRQAPSNEP
jgi:hypothetical protein